MTDTLQVITMTGREDEAARLAGPINTPETATPIVGGRDR